MSDYLKYQKLETQQETRDSSASIVQSRPSLIKKLNASGRSNSSISGFLNSVNKRNKQVEEDETSPKMLAKNLKLDMIGKTFPHDQSYTEI